jgi:hypothetical protein
MKRFKQRKAIYSSGEDALPSRFTKKLVKNGWRYLPKDRSLTRDQVKGGHWVPPGFIPIKTHNA